MLDVAVEHLPQVERLEEVVGAAAARVLGLDDLPHVAAHGLGDVVDVLGLDGGDEVVLEDAGEVVLELGAAEVNQDLSPVWRRVVFTEVGLQLARQDLQSRRLPDSVRPH